LLRDAATSTPAWALTRPKVEALRTLRSSRPLGYPGGARRSAL